MHSTADWIKSAAPRDSVIAICRNVLTFRAEFLPNTHTRAYLVRHVHLSPLIKTIDGATKSIESRSFDSIAVISRVRSNGQWLRVYLYTPSSQLRIAGRRDLRKLEMDFLPVGIEVSRTADDLLLYHYKFLIIDR